MKVPLSVVIITKNEEKRIKDCLESVCDWAEEIIVVDDESTDQTRQIVSSYTDQIFVRKMEIEGRHRNWAYAKAKYDWVLSLDADERMLPELKEEINQVLKSESGAVAFTIPRKNFIGDYWIRGAGLYPAAQLKLFRKDKFKWEEASVHPRALLDGQCAHLKNSMLHYTYRDFGDFLHKLNNQTTLEAMKWIEVYKTDTKKAEYKMNIIHALWRYGDRFIRAYFVKKGYCDGFIGFMVSLFASLYQIVSYCKYWEMRRKEVRGKR
ncbi:MAG: glycosyltransferase family 2 protein [Candidatus Omnitrophota bacterium]|nr:glycosyltransferase family 2 protein [Candidatus Omnitrophota bacterium]